MIAVGAYIRTLREAQKMSRADLAAKTNTSGSQLVRIENGEQDTRSTLLAAIVNHLGGDFYDVAHLLLHPDATAEEGRQLALKHLQDQGYPGMEPYEDGYIPTTALGVFLEGLRKIEDLESEFRDIIDEDSPYNELTDSYLHKIDQGQIKALDIAIKLQALKVKNDVITFLVNNPDLPAHVGEHLAMTRIGIGSVEDIMRKARESKSSNAA